MKRTFTFMIMVATLAMVKAQTTAVLHADQGTQIIPKEIYGQFAEHLGSCIYGGLRWEKTLTSPTPTVIALMC